MLAVFVEDIDIMTLKYLTLFALLASAAVPASALTQAEIEKCNAMSQSFSAKQTAIKKAKAALDKKAELAEEAGERWEAAEEMKLISARNAKMASDAKTEWERLKNEVYREQMALQSNLKMLNKDIAAFNTSCATED